MAYWLLKTEPGDYSWDQLVLDGETEWTGVRSHQAARNMRAMKAGERAFFYRSAVDPAIVGVMTVAREWYPDAEDERFCRVRVKPLRPVVREVPLKAIREDGRFGELALIRQSRLSVLPVSEEHWRALCAMAGIAA